MLVIFIFSELHLMTSSLRYYDSLWYSVNKYKALYDLIMLSNRQPRSIIRAVYFLQKKPWKYCFCFKSFVHGTGCIGSFQKKNVSVQSSSWLFFFKFVALIRSRLIPDWLLKLVLPGLLSCDSLKSFNCLVKRKYTNSERNYIIFVPILFYM